MTIDELIELFLDGKINLEQYIIIHNSIMKRQSEEAMKYDKPGTPHEHI